LRDPQDSLGHHGQNGGLDAQKQRLHPRGITQRRIAERQRKDHQRAGQHEQPTRDQPADDAAFFPPGIGRQLHRLGPRQQHAERQAAQEFLFR
jgi:hypothetical protein